MSHVVLLRLAGPMQSWGTRSRFGYRDTETEPSKSGVIGLLGAALGLPRDADWGELTQLRMGVRVDRAGYVETDFQTALDVVKSDGGENKNAVMSWRQYLADARFLVGFEGDEVLCNRLRTSLRRPRWPLFLGRKGYVAGEPIASLPVVQGTLEEVMAVEDWPKDDSGQPLTSCVFIVDCEGDQPGDERLDVPVNFAFGKRCFRTRRVRRTELISAHLGDGLTKGKKDGEA